MEVVVIRKIINKVFRFNAVEEFKVFQTIASGYGHYKTIKSKSCIDNYYNEIPWYTYPSIEYFNNIDFRDKKIFEFGSGNSSIYWSKKANKVVSVENNSEWYKKVMLSLNSNQELVLCPNNSDYENSIKKQERKYDVIIIDGIRRGECSKVIDGYLNKESDDGYMVILDNSDWYKDTSKYLREKLGLIEIDFHGFGPINSYTWTTSVFLSRTFKFKPINDVQPSFSIAAIKQNGEGDV